MKIERPCRLSERPPDLRRAGASEPRPLGSKARRVLSRNEAQIGGDTGGVGKPVDIIQRRHESRGRHGADAGHRHQPAHADVCTRQDFQLEIRLSDLRAERLEDDEYALKVRRQAFGVVEQGLSHFRGQRVGRRRRRAPIRDRR